MITAHVVPNDDPGGAAILTVIQWPDEDEQDEDEKARVRYYRKRSSVCWRR